MVPEERINLWARAISETEETKCQNAISMVTDAIRQKFGRQVNIVQQGSHRNRTNIRADSDVDIAVVFDGSYFPDVRNLPTAHQSLHLAALPNATYGFEQFKTDVHQALLAKFNVSSVLRKNKCIRVNGNDYRVSADVVPAFQSKRFHALHSNPSHNGIGILTDREKEVIHSYPEQHYANGVAKNDVTSQAYKAAVRVLKNARNEMETMGLIEKDSMSSFFLECLVWNAPISCFSTSSYREDARSVALQTWQNMKTNEAAQRYVEVSGLEWLFRYAHRTPTQASNFMLSAWSHLSPT